MGLRIAFMGTPEISVPALKNLVEAGHEIVCVYSQPPKPSGRGHRLTPSPVHQFAEQHNIPVRTPRSLKNAEEQAFFKSLNLDAAIVIAYGLILPKAILETPRLGCLNIHVSLLPRWRGASPIQRAILAGDNETGITIIQMDEGLDTGDMLAIEKLPITPDATASSLHDTLSQLGARMIVETLDQLNAGKITPEKQSDDGVTYAHKLTKEDGRIDWQQPAKNIDQQIRALNPWPGTWFTYQDETFKVMEAKITEGNAAPGTLLDQVMTIACGDQALRLTRIQRAGKSPVSGKDFLLGYKIETGTIFNS